MSTVLATDSPAYLAYQAYDLPGNLLALEPLGNGLINKTYRILQGDDQGWQGEYVLQEINQSIFPDVPGLMQNILAVTDYMKGIISRRGGDPERETLTVVLNREGLPYTRLEDGTYWRIYEFIKDSFSIEQVTNEDEFYRAGQAFGAFAADLDDFDASQLTEVIPKFHDTRHRYAQFEEAVAQDRAGRAAEVQEWIDFVRARKSDCYLLYDLLDAGQLPLRVTHNDTKLNNILMDASTGQALCIVDLDTIMPGLVLFDYGDAIRFGANHNAEDEADLSKVQFDAHLFEVYTRGFLKGMGDRLTTLEIELLPWGARVITLEQGIRFLTDYLNGDIYYGTSRPGQNLDRTATQLTLVAQMEAQWPELKAVVARAAQSR